MLRFCIVTRLFHSKLNYRENVIESALESMGLLHDVYFIDGDGSSDTNTRYFIKCKSIMRIGDSTVAFNSKILQRKYNFAFINDARQFFTCIFAVILNFRGAYVIYDHEQRSDGISFIGKLFSIIFVRHLIYITAKNAKIIRVPNELSEKYILEINYNFREKIVQIPLSVDTSIFFPVSFSPQTSNKCRFKIAWTGKSPYKKNINLLITSIADMIDRYSNLHIEFYIITDEKISTEFKFIQSSGVLLSSGDLADFYRTCDATIWTTPTQSYFESAACGNFVIAPLSGVPKSINNYTNLFFPVQCECNSQGLAFDSIENINAFSNVLSEVIQLWSNDYKAKPYTFSGEDMVREIISSI